MAEYAIESKQYESLMSFVGSAVRPDARSHRLTTQ